MEVDEAFALLGDGDGDVFEYDFYAFDGGDVGDACAHIACADYAYASGAELAEAFGAIGAIADAIEVIPEGFGHILAGGGKADLGEVSGDYIKGLIEIDLHTFVDGVDKALVGGLIAAGAVVGLGVDGGDELGGLGVAGVCVLGG